MAPNCYILSILVKYFDIKLYTYFLLLMSFKVPISWLGVLHIYNIWNPLIRIAIYLVVTVNTRSYRHTENISLDFEPNTNYLMKIN